MKLKFAVSQQKMRIDIQVLRGYAILPVFYFMQNGVMSGLMFYLMGKCKRIKITRYFQPKINSAGV